MCCLLTCKTGYQNETAFDRNNAADDWRRRQSAIIPESHVARHLALWRTAAAICLGVAAAGARTYGASTGERNAGAECATPPKWRDGAAARLRRSISDAGMVLPMNTID